MTASKAVDLSGPDRPQGPVLMGFAFGLILISPVNPVQSLRLSVLSYKVQSIESILSLSCLEVLSLCGLSLWSCLMPFGFGLMGFGFQSIRP